MDSQGMNGSMPRIGIVIVDDIADTRDNLSKLLMFERDIEVVGTAGSGPEALEMARKLLPDVVLMDINMPEMDGIELARRATEVCDGGGRRCCPISRRVWATCCTPPRVRCPSCATWAGGEPGGASRSASMASTSF